MKPNISITSVVFHRNGVMGAPFYAILFAEKQVGVMVANLFQAPGHCAVFSLQEPSIVSKTNTWRGDLYEEVLRPALAGFLKVPDPFA